MPGKGAQRGPDHAKLESHGWAVNNSISTEAAYFSRTLTDIGYVGRSTRWLTESEQRGIGFTIRVPESGYYDISVISGLHTDGGTTDFSLDGRQITTFTSEDTSITGDMQLSEPIGLAKAYLTKGDHTVRFWLRRKYHIMLNQLIFKPAQLPAGSFVMIAGNLGLVPVGGTRTASLGGSVEGISIPLNEAEITPVSGDPSVAEAAIVTKDGKPALQVTGVARGARRRSPCAENPGR